MKNIFYALIAVAIVLVGAAVISFIVNFERIEDTTSTLANLGTGVALLALSLVLYIKRK